MGRGHHAGCQPWLNLRVPTHMPRFQRPRHEVGPVVKTLVKPFFRYSTTRDAYVLRVVGNQHGPVLKERRERTLG